MSAYNLDDIGSPLDVAFAIVRGDSRIQLSEEKITERKKLAQDKIKEIQEAEYQLSLAHDMIYDKDYGAWFCSNCGHRVDLIFLESNTRFYFIKKTKENLKMFFTFELGLTCKVSKIDLDI